MMLYFFIELMKKIEIEADFKLDIEAEVGVDFKLAVEPDFVFKFVVVGFELEQQPEIVFGFAVLVLVATRAVFVFDLGLESVELVVFVVVEFVVVAL